MIRNLLKNWLGITALENRLDKPFIYEDKESYITAEFYKDELDLTEDLPPKKKPVRKGGKRNG